MWPRLLRAALVCGWFAAVLAGPEARRFEVALQPQSSQDKTLLAPQGSDGMAPFDDSIAQGTFVPEIEPNGTDATSTPLGGADVLARGTILPGGDVDWWSFTGNAGDRVYVALQTAFSSELANGGNSELRLFKPNGNTLVELDQDDGFFNDAASSIAGAELQTAGTYFLQVKHFDPSSQLRPYYLHFRRMSGSPSSESEPNDSAGTANPLPASGWVSGTHSSFADLDLYAITLGAGDTVFLSLDMDPERDNAPTPGGWDGRLGLGFFGDAGDQILAADDVSNADPANPRSEALFLTVKYAGTYYVTVDSASEGGPTDTYRLAASVHHAAAVGVQCQTYSSGDVNLAIGPLNGAVTNSTIFVPGSPRIEDLNVSIVLDHTEMADIDAALLSPAGNQNSLFTDVGPTTPGGQTKMDLDLDDEAAIPIGYFTAMKGMAYQPEFQYRLSWFKGENAGGTWTLRLRDDAGPTRGGTLTSWSLTICQPPPQVCEGTVVTAYSSNFETGADGFTHAGTQDEWARGNPTSVPVTGCNSGSNCWKTDLTGNYNAGSDQSLLSPNISLSGLTKPILVTWAQKYQMENASFDTFSVEVREPGPVNATTLFRHQDATMQDTVGSPATTLNESAGWGLVTRRIDAYSNKTIQLQWNLTSDSSLFFAGLAVDDVLVTGCQCTAAGCDDGNPCTTDTCDPVQGCVHTNRTGSCDDGNACTASDTCTNGVCGGPPVTCIDGDPCTVDTCNPASGCQFQPMDCNDGNPCTTDGCSGGTCTHLNNALPCDDGSACTLNDVCGGGACGGTPLSCDDGDACTDDGCNPASGCTHGVHSCDDANACTDETCNPASGCQYTPHGCNDGNACTDDSCTPQTGCQHAPHSCDDTNLCTDDTCNPASGCQYAAHSCDDGSACTDDSCSPATGCFNTTHSCDDGDTCTQDSCSPQTGCLHADRCAHYCNAAVLTIVDSNVPPTQAVPYPSTISVSGLTGNLTVAAVKLLGLTHGQPRDVDMLLVAPGGQNATVLSDTGGSATTGANLVLRDTASAFLPSSGALSSGTFRPTNYAPADAFPAPAPVPSGASALATFDGAAPNGIWSLYVVDDAFRLSGSLSGGWCLDLLVSCTLDAHCSDGNACTVDTCVGGQCQTAPLACDDGNACTDDSCDAQAGCTHGVHSCDDANVCTVESCDPQAGCQQTPLSCDDGNACTDDSCSPQAGCAHGPHVCNDANACTADSCDPATGCLTAPISCDDGNACTDDSCDQALGCQTTPVSCDDGDACTDDSCNPQTGCAHGPHVCNDANACTADSCDPATGCLMAPISCDDGNACTDDSCDPGAGCQTTPVSCDDGDACTVDGCDAEVGCTAVPRDCDDLDACTVDTCDSQTGCKNTPLGLPGEVDGLVFLSDKQMLSWEATAHATAYEVARGDLVSLPVGSGADVCLGSWPATSAMDAEEPSLAKGFWYIVRGTNPCAGAGSYGEASGGVPRATPACP